MKKQTNIPPTASVAASNARELPDGSSISESQLPEFARRYTEREMRTQGQVTPTCMLLIDASVTTFCSKVTNSADKDKFVLVARLLALAYKATALATVVEAWAASHGNGQNPQLTASQSPDRRECIVINMESGTSTAMRMFFIKRDTQGAFTGLEQDSLLPENEQFTGRFAGILPPQPVSKDQSVLACRLLEAMGVWRAWRQINELERSRRAADATARGEHNRAPSEPYNL